MVQRAPIQWLKNLPVPYIRVMSIFISRSNLEKMPNQCNPCLEVLVELLVGFPLDQQGVKIDSTED